MKAPPEGEVVPFIIIGGTARSLGGEGHAWGVKHHLLQKIFPSFHRRGVSQSIVHAF